MKSIYRNYRYYVLSALITIAILGILAEPLESLPFDKWLLALAISKTISFLAGYSVALLIGKWERHGKIPEITRLLYKL